MYHGKSFENVKQKIIEAGDCAGVVRVLSQRFTDDSIDHCSGGVGCSVSYKRMVDILNTNSSSLNVFAVALLFSYRRHEINYLQACNTTLSEDLGAISGEWGPPPEFFLIDCAAS